MSTSNNLPRTGTQDKQLQQRRAITGILEYAISSLELTQVQRADVEATYHECGEHLALKLGRTKISGEIFPQGSMRLGTVIRPLRNITDVFDLDVVFLLLLPSSGKLPSNFRDDVGSHLRQKYNGTVKPLAKGWRLDFSKERDYHLDVIPAMISSTGGNIIAITDSNNWRDSNPRDYATWFESRAKLQPRFAVEAMAKEGAILANRASIEPLPEHTPFKQPLQRIVQIAKRHRDYYFSRVNKDSSQMPASIVLTTLLAKAYERCVNSRAYESGFDLMLSCVEDMPNYFDQMPLSEAISQEVYILRNPSLSSENLVEKWKDRRLAQAFRDWHGSLMVFLRAIIGTDSDPRRLLTETLGDKPINAAFAKQASTFNSARENRLLTINTTSGLTLGSSSIVPRHKIHGS
jgi:hypothetical protein